MAQQSKGKKLGHNISADHERIYNEIETTIFKSAPKFRDGSLKLKKKNRKVYARCGRGLRKNKYNHTHKGDRWLPIREFAIYEKDATKLQNACRDCDHNYRVNGRSAANRKKYDPMTVSEIHKNYAKEYPAEKGNNDCSRNTGCLHPNGPRLPSTEFGISRGMETGLHNHCKICVSGYSKGAVGDRFIDFMPDGKVINRKIPKGGKVNCVYYPKAHGKNCKGKLHDDHIWPLAVGGSDYKENHQWLCAEHNQTKSSSPDMNLKTVQSIKEKMLSDRFRSRLKTAQKKKTSVKQFHRDMRSHLTKDRIARSKKSITELEKIYTTWVRKNNRKHDVKRAAKKMKEFRV